MSSSCHQWTESERSRGEREGRGEGGRGKKERREGRGSGRRGGGEGRRERGYRWVDVRVERGGKERKEEGRIKTRTLLPFSGHIYVHVYTCICTVHKTPERWNTLMPEIIYMYTTCLFYKVSTADGSHVSWYGEVECPVTRLSVGVHTGEPQPGALHSIVGDWLLCIHVHLKSHTIMLTVRSFPSHNWRHECVARGQGTHCNTETAENRYM